jgi:hypothetical protein
MNQDQIKQIKDFPNYHISTKGTVYRTLKDNSLREVKGYQDKQSKLIYVTLINKTTTKHYSRASLVAETFIPNPNNKRKTLHIEGPKTNDHVNNIKWVTQRDIIYNTRDTGNMKTKINQAIAEEIRVLYETGEACYSEIARMFDVDYTTIIGVIKGYLWKGFKVLSSSDPLLSWDLVRLIRKRYKEERITQTKLALEYNLTPGRVSLITRSKIWKENK